LSERSVNRTKNPAVAGMSRSYRLHPKASVRLPVAEKKRFPRVTTVSYTLLCARYIEATTNTRIHRLFAHVGVNCKQQLCI